LSGLGGLAPGILDVLYGSNIGLIGLISSPDLGEPLIGLIFNTGDGVLVLIGVEEREGLGDGLCVGVLACDEGFGLFVLSRTETGD